MKYYKGFSYKCTDKETAFITISSTKEEPKRVGKIFLTNFETTEGAIVSVKIEREYIVEKYRTTGLTKDIEHSLLIDAVLSVGQELTILAKDITTGTHSLVQGYIEYEITK